jgi:hypothetical protein
MTLASEVEIGGGVIIAQTLFSYGIRNPIGLLAVTDRFALKMSEFRPGKKHQNPIPII